MQRWTRFIYSLFFILITLLIVFKFEYVKETVRLLNTNNSIFLFLAFVAQILTYVFSSVTYRAILRVLKFRIRYITLFKISIVITFLNSIMPTLGLSGSAALFKVLRSNKIPEGKVLLVILLSSILMGLNFIFMIMFSTLGLFFSKDINFLNLSLSILSFLAILLITIMLLKTASDKEKFTYFVINIIKKFNKLFKKNFNTEKFVETIKELYEGLIIIRSDKKHFLIPMFFSFLKILLDVITIFLIFQSFDMNVSLLVIIFGYTMSTIFGVISFLPGGLGIFELSMAGIFTSFGIPLSVSIAAVLLFRLFSYWLPIISGFMLFKNTMTS